MTRDGCVRVAGGRLSSITLKRISNGAYHDYYKMCIGAVEAKSSCDSQGCCVHGLQKKYEKTGRSQVCGVYALDQLIKILYFTRHESVGGGSATH